METTAATRSSVTRASIFSRILCGIDGSRAACEAAAQAAALAGPGARIELVAVTWESGYGPTAQALLSHARAKEGLRAASKFAEKDGIEVVTTMRTGSSPAHVLLDEAQGHDLLVLGSHGASRKTGIMVGSTVSLAVHEAHLPILVARPAPSESPFPTRVLVGADGPGQPESAIELSAQLARNCGSRVTLLRVGGWTRAHTREIDEALVELAEASSIEPVELVSAGEPHRRLVEAAAREHASLIIVGSRALTGVRALTSTSERVAHEAGCSVLVLRPA